MMRLVHTIANIGTLPEEAKREQEGHVLQQLYTVCTVYNT